MKILVLNAGSSSLKFDLFDDETPLGQGEVERMNDMGSALTGAFSQLAGVLGGNPVQAVGHRFVHGGDKFFSAVVIDREVEEQLQSLEDLAPLHMPQNLAAYRAARNRLPDAIHVAVFDTAFHHDMPPRAYRYAIPETYYREQHIRRYGFHGISHRYIAERYAAMHPESGPGLRLLSCHLGNGCSAAAIVGGKSIDTSMGFTPLEGLVMGTRSGDIDPGAVLHLILRGKQDPAALEKVLNGESGLAGLSGLSNDMRDLHRAADSNERAKLAIDVFCYRLKKYIGSYFAAMNGLDALVFTGGIGENDAEVRAQACADMTALGIELDAASNRSVAKTEARIGQGRVDIWVIPTREELMIARDTLRCARS